jgi:hypothetical protein
MQIWRGASAAMPDNTLVPRLFLVIAFAAAALAAPPDPNRGLYAIWTGEDATLGQLPFIKGGQVLVQWKTVEPREGQYDFSSVDRQFEALGQRGQGATIQINGNEHPDYLFAKVPYIAKKLSVQVRDSRGTLAYWHPAYIKAYMAMLHACAAHLKQARYRAAVLGVRLNFNALGTEHTAVAAEDRDPSRWTVPPGAAAAAPWTREISEAYRRQVVDVFVREFTPEIRVFVRNNFFAGGDADPAWVRMLETGRLALFHTSSEIEPRPHGSGQYEVFLKYCRSGQTVCYAESWADALGRHGGQTDPRWCPPAQYNYWRLLGDLNWGVSFIAIYGADLKHRQDPEYRAAFDFAASYAGYHASPQSAPGAWVALREGHQIPGDYSFLMNRLKGDDMPPLEKAGPDDQRFGAWARLLKKGTKAVFALNPEFATSLTGKPATVSFTYLDRGRGQIELRNSGTCSYVPVNDTGRWLTAEFPVGKSAFDSGITLSADTDVAVHMLEVRRWPPGL